MLSCSYQKVVSRHIFLPLFLPLLLGLKLIIDVIEQHASWVPTL
jgi:hypothetical protein